MYFLSIPHIAHEAERFAEWLEREAELEAEPDKVYKLTQAIEALRSAKDHLEGLK